MHSYSYLQKSDNKSGLFHPKIRRFKIPFRRGGVPLGDISSVVILRVLKNYRDYFSEDVILAYEEIATDLKDCALILNIGSDDVHPAILFYQVGGGKRESDLYRGFIESPHTDTSGLDSLRFIILLVVAKPKRKRGAISGILTIVEAIKQAISDSETEKLTRVAEDISQAIAEHSTTSLQSHLTKLIPNENERNGVILTLINTIQATAAPAKSAVKKDPTDPPEPRGWFLPQLPDELHIPTDSDLHEDDSVDPICWDIVDTLEDTEEDTETNELTDKEKNLEQIEAEIDTRLNLTGPFLPDTERVLSKHEIQVNYEYLWDDLNKIVGLNKYKRVAIPRVILGLMIVTGKHRTTIKQAVRAYLSKTEDQNNNLRICPDYWTGTPVMEYPEASNTPKTWLDNIEDNVRYPMPEDIKQTLNRLHTEDCKKINWATVDLWFDTELDRLKKKTPRTNQLRLRTTLLAQLYARTGHPRDWFLITGQCAFRSTSPLNYYSPRVSDLEKKYIEALEDFGIHCSPINSGNQNRTGAPRGALKLSMVNKSVTDIRERTKAAISKVKHPTQHPGDSINLITSYVAIWFCAVTSHRFTKHIQEITVRDFLLNTPKSGLPSFVTMNDKGIYRSVSERTAAITNELASQIQWLCEWYWQKAAALQRGGPDCRRKYKAVIKALQDASTGKGPLFIAVDINDDSKIVLLSKKMISDTWPEWETEPQYLRHIFASNAEDFGVQGCDIAQQMGHMIDGNPYDTCDPDSPFEFALRIQPALSRYSESLGFSPLIERQRKNKIVEPPAPLSVKAILAKYNNKIKDYENYKKNLIPALDKEIDLEINRKVQKILSGFSNFLSRDDLAKIRREARTYIDQNENINQIRLFLNKLIKQIKPRIRKYRRHLTLRFPGLILLERPMVSVDIANIEAHRFTQHFASWLSQNLRNAESTEDAPHFIISGIFKLAEWGFSTQLERLVSMLGDGTDLYFHPEVRGGAIAMVPLDLKFEDPSSRESQFIPEHTLPLFLKLRETFQKHNLTDEDLNQVADSWEELQTVAGTSTNIIPCILETIGLQRQLVTSGCRAAWESRTLPSVGLSIERLNAVLEGDVQYLGCPQHRTKKHASLTPQGSDAILPEDDFAKLRLSFGKFSNQTSSSKRKSILKENYTKIIESYPPESLLNILAHAIKDHVERDTLDLSSVYTYLTTLTKVIKPNISQEFGLTGMEMIERDLRRMLLNGLYEGNGEVKENTKTITPQAANWLIQHAGNHGFIIEASEVFKDLEQHSVRRPGYLMSQTELDWITEQAGIWTENAYDNISRSNLALICASYELGHLLQSSHSLRISELAGALLKDTQFINNTISINVHPRRKRGLKTISSRRIACRSSDDNRAKRVKLLIERLHGRRIDVQGELLSTGYRMKLESILDRHSSLVAQAYRRILEPGAARSHVHRHTFANSAALEQQPNRLRGINLKLPPSGIEQFNMLPKRMQLRYTSRQLGHGAVESTLTWYDHTITLHTDVMRFSSWLDASLQAELLGIALNSYQNRAHRERYLARQITAFPPRGSNPLDDGEFTDHPSLTQASSSEYESLGHLALRIREGLSDEMLAHEVGVDHKKIKAIRENLERADKIIGTKYFKIAWDRSNRKNSRLAQAHKDIGFLKIIDKLINEGAITHWEIFLWLADELQKPKSRSMDVSALPNNVGSRLLRALASGSVSSGVAILPTHLKQWIALVLYAGCMAQIPDSPTS